MTVKVKLFAVLRDQSGTPELELTLPAPSTTSAVVSKIAAQFPSLKVLLSRTAIAVNQSYVQRDHPLAEGDEVALIPPVSGG